MTAPVPTDELLRLARVAWPDSRGIRIDRGISSTVVRCDGLGEHVWTLLAARSDLIHDALRALAGELDVAALVAERDRYRATLDVVRELIADPELSHEATTAAVLEARGGVMTDRLKGCVVVFTDDFREDDAEPLLNAIRMLKGVASVHVDLDVTDHRDYVARYRVRHELRAKLFAAIDEAFEVKS